MTPGPVLDSQTTCRARWSGRVGCAGVMLIALLTSAAPASAADPLVVCVKSDGVMRLLDGTSSCASGETKRLFAAWQPEVLDAPSASPEESNSTINQQAIQDLSNRIAALEKSEPEQPRPDKTEALRVEELTARVTALENGKHRVTAPFEVVGPGGKLILGVGQFNGGQGISVMGPNNEEVIISSTADGKIGLSMEVGDKKVTLNAEELSLSSGSRKLVAEAGHFEMKDGDNEFSAEAAGLDLTDGDSNFGSLTAKKLDMNISGDTSTTVDPNGLRVLKGDSSIAELYRREGSDKAAMRIIKDGQNMAAVGINEFEKGALYVGDGAKTLAAVQGIGDGTGVVDVIGPGGASAAGLAVGENGRGLIAVRDASGKPIAAMTVSSDSSGGNITIWKGDLGVFSAGAASDGGGEACLNRVTGGGQQKLVCLGVGLPGFGGMP